MTARHRWVGVAAAAAGVGAIGLALAIFTRDSETEPSSGAREVTRVVRVFRRPWESACHSDVCKIRIVFTVSLTTPVEAKGVDLVATVGLTYRTSRGDRAVASLVLKTERPPWPAMPPGELLLPSAAGNGSTETLTWARHNLPAGGRKYALELFVAPRGGRTRTGGLSVAGAKTVLVAEMTPVN